MNVTESSSESEGPITSRTRSRNVGFSIPATTWCSCAGATREINESSSSNSSLSLSNSYLETEFPAFPGPPAMENRSAHALPPDLIELLQEMTDQLHAHEQHIEGAPRASGLQPPVFRGSPTDYFDEWLQKFQRYAIFNRWTPEQQLNGFMMFWGGGGGQCIARLSASNTRSARKFRSFGTGTAPGICFTAPTIPKTPRVKQSHAGTARIIRELFG